jgi:hypothetical protein
LLVYRYSDFFNFSTRRRAISSLHSTFTLHPRHDLFQYIYDVLREVLDLNFQLAADLSALDCILAMSSKRRSLLAFLGDSCAQLPGALLSA